jgi:hypothetical protein
MLETNDEEGDAPKLEKEGQEVLPDKIVERLVVEKTMKQNLKPGEQRKKSKEKKWGPVLVDRPRRNQNTWEIVLQKAMQIKKRKNLEVVKGNFFSILQSDYLNQVAHDANIKIDWDNDENSRLINNLKNEESLKQSKFVIENPDMLLPMNLDFEVEIQDALTPFDIDSPEKVSTPTDAGIEPDTSALWTEVVRKGRKRNKTKNANNKIHSNERCGLEY